MRNLAFLITLAYDSHDDAGHRIMGRNLATNEQQQRTFKTEYERYGKHIQRKKVIRCVREENSKGAFILIKPPD